MSTVRGKSPFCPERGKGPRLAGTSFSCEESEEEKRLLPVPAGGSKKGGGKSEKKGKKKGGGESIARKKKKGGGGWDVRPRSEKEKGNGLLLHF